MWTVFQVALASDAGHVGSSDEGCRPCHGTVSDPRTDARFEGDTSVAPGALVDVVLVVATDDPERVAAGFDVLATAGTLVPGPGVHLDAGELTHDARFPLAGGAVAVTFGWRAPDEPGTWRLRAAANTVDGDGLASGDGWTLAPALAVRVDPACVDQDGDGVQGCDGDCDDDDPARVACGGPPSDTGAADEGAECGCSGSPPAVAAVSFVVVLTRGRRRSAPRSPPDGAGQPRARTPRPEEARPPDVGGTQGA